MSEDNDHYKAVLADHLYRESPLYGKKLTFDMLNFENTALIKPQGRFSAHAFPCAVAPRYCEARSHDLRSDKFFDCLKKISQDIDKQDVEVLTRMFRAKREEYRYGEYKENLAATEAALLKDTYTDSKHIYRGLLLLRYYGSINELATFPKAFTYWSDTRNFCDGFLQLRNSVQIEIEEKYGAEVKALIADHNAGKRKTVAVTNEPAAPVKIEKDLYSLTLGELVTARNSETEKSTPKPKVEQVKEKWWKRAVSVTVQPPFQATAELNRIVAFIGTLPPKSREMFHLYESVLDNPVMNSPEVLARLEEEYAEMLAHERSILAEESTPLDAINSMLEKIKGS